MWEITAFIAGFMIGSLSIHYLAQTLYSEKIKLYGQLKLDLEDLYARLKNLKNA